MSATMDGSEYNSTYHDATTQASSSTMSSVVSDRCSTSNSMPLCLEGTSRYEEHEHADSCHSTLPEPSGDHDMPSIEVTVPDCGDDGDEAVEITVSPGFMFAAPSRSVGEFTQPVYNTSLSSHQMPTHAPPPVSQDAGPSSAAAAYYIAGCYLCDKLFSSKTSLRDHLVTAHQERSTKTPVVGRKRKRSNAGGGVANWSPLPSSPHPSVCTDVPTLMARLQLPRCTLCRFSPRYAWLESLRLHFNMSHVQRAVQLQDGTALLRCRLFCDRRTHCHYHCPGCDYLSPRIKRIKSHVSACGHVSTSIPHASTLPTNSVADDNPVICEVMDQFSNVNYKKSTPNLQRTKIKRDKAGRLKPSADKAISSNTKLNSSSINKKCIDLNGLDAVSLRGIRSASPSDISDAESLDLSQRNIAIHATDDAPDSDYMSVTIVKSEPVEAVSYCDTDLSSLESSWVKVKEERIVKAEHDHSEGDICIHEIGEPRAVDDEQLSSLPCFAASLQEAFDRLSCGSCYLCSQAPQFDSHLALELHFYRSHVRHSVSGLDGRLVLVCGLACDGCPGLHVHCTRCRHQQQDVQAMLQHCHHRHRLLPDPAEHSKDILRIKSHCHPILAELLMLEPDAEQFPFMAAEFSPDAQLTVITDAYLLYCRIKPPRCVLCEDGHEYKALTKLHKHFQRSHIKRANSSCPVPSLVCRLSCKGYGRGHYHCPFCSYTMHDINKLRIHQHETHRVLLKRAELDKARGITITADGGGDQQDQELEECLKTCDGGFVKGKKKVRESTSLTQATSIVSNFDEIRNKIQLPDCLLCRSTRNFVTEKRLREHLEKTHIKQAIKATESLYVLNCRLYSNKYKTRGHFHCPWCLFQSHDRTIFTNHINNHNKKIELSRQQTKALMMARLLNPDYLGQYRVDPQQVSASLRSQVQSWQLRFNQYLKSDFSQSLKRNSCVMAHRRRKAIIDYLLFGAPLEPYLAGYVTFKNYSVMTSPELGLDNCLVEPVVRYKRHDQDASVDRSFRKVTCVEEFFKVLYELHVLPSGEHNTLQELSAQVRSRYVFLPNVVVPKFLELCPLCKSSTTFHPKTRLHKTRNRRVIGQATLPSSTDQVSAKVMEPVTCGTMEAFSDGGEGTGPYGVGRLTPDDGPDTPLSKFMTILQVNLVDMSEHPDGEHSYVVHCQDHHSQLHFLFPLGPQLNPESVARGVSCRVLANTGLPGLILSNYGKGFVRTLLSHLKSSWTSECDELIQRCHDASDEGNAGLNFEDSDVVTKELTNRVQCCQREGQDITWAAWLPHLQYTLNTRAQRPDPCPYQLAFHRLP